MAALRESVLQGQVCFWARLEVASAPRTSWKQAKAIAQLSSSYLMSFEVYHRSLWVTDFPG